MRVGRVRHRSGNACSPVISFVRPRATWPDNACNECGGHGWLAQVVKTVKQKKKNYKDYIVAEFVFARDARGETYEPVELPLHGLELFVAWPSFSSDDDT